MDTDIRNKAENKMVKVSDSVESIKSFGEKSQKNARKKMASIIKISVVTILLLTAAFSLYYFKFSSTVKASTKQQTAVVSKGDLSVTITGSGAITSSNRKEISTVLDSDSKVTKVYFKQGDKVKTGDLMFELDDSSAQSSVEAASNSLTQAQLTQNSTVSDIGKLNITAPFSGYVTNVSVKEGDSVNNGATILTLIDKSKFKITVNFMATTKINVGDEITLNLSSAGAYQILKGKVSFVSDKTSLSASGSALRSIDITLDNPGYTLEGLAAGAEIGGIQSDDTGTFSYAKTQVIKAGVEGTVKKLNVTSNQYITAGTAILELQSDTLISSKEKGDLNLSDFQTKLDNAKEKLKNYKIYATIDGTIVKQTIKVGDTVKSADILSTVSDNGHLQFSISVDELDISKIKTSQKVKITVDALSETSTNPISGTVSDIALEGTSTNGVTTYPVTITVDNPENLKGGMNANASIIVSDKANSLYVPIEAVQKVSGKSMVWVKTNDANNSKNTASAASKANSYYANAVKKEVTVGISNSTNIEIVSGLNEGDVVVLPEVTTQSTSSATSTSKSKSTNSGMGSMGGMGGGPDSGGPPPN